MKKLKNILLIIIVFVACFFASNYIYNAKTLRTKEVFSESEDIFLLQFGVYSTKESMNESTKDLSNYFYYSSEDGYHVLIGITKNEDLIEKIRDSYYITDNIYSKKVSVSNIEFLETLKQYDELVNLSTDKNIIVNAEKQILSKYEELILRSE